MNTEPDYDNLSMVRMAIVERDDRLVVLMPPHTDQFYMDQFVENYVAYGWPRDRVLVMRGPTAFAVLKGSVEDEGQGAEEQAEGDQVDAPEGGDSDGGDDEADRGDDPEEQIESDSHTNWDTQTDYSSHGVTWRGQQ